MALIARKSVYLRQILRLMYIYEHREWPVISWNRELVGEKLNEVYNTVGYLMGRLSLIGFDESRVRHVWTGKGALCGYRGHGTLPSRKLQDALLSLTSAHPSPHQSLEI